MVKQISLAEVKKHRTRNDLWMVIHNDVYDVTKFVDEHPGGVETLMDMAGQDATEAFEDVGHSEDARTLLKKFKVGTLPASEKTFNVKSNKLQMALLALAGAVIVGFLVKKYLMA